MISAINPHPVGVVSPFGDRSIASARQDHGAERATQHTLRSGCIAVAATFALIWVMAEMQKVRTGRHCAFVMHVHLVFVTKFRHKVFTDAHLVRMEEIMRSVCADFECTLVEFNGEDNHVHLLVNFPPKVAVTKLVNSLKGVSSRRPRQEFPDLVRHYWRADKLWSGSYFDALRMNPGSAYDHRPRRPPALPREREIAPPQGRCLEATSKRLP